MLVEINQGKLDQAKQPQPRVQGLREVPWHYPKVRTQRIAGFLRFFSPGTNISRWKVPHTDQPDRARGLDVYHGPKGAYFSMPISQSD